MSKDGFSYSSGTVDSDARITIIASKWNAELVNELVKSGKSHLRALGLKKLKTIYVPGAWELVHAAQKELEHAEGVIAYGVIIRGETSHYELISESAAQGLMQVSINAKKPLAFGLIATENFEQAKERADPLMMNKGREIAQSLIEMLK
tara:strand:- start:2257 stop:2703 length:447 start_codon:yes stop_codon:yes gene_type:complete